MNYSSIVEDSRTKYGSFYDKFRLALQLFANGANNVYVLKIPLVDLPEPVAKQDGVRIIRMPNSIDFIVRGTFEHIEHIAQKIHNNTGEIVGGIHIKQPYLTGVIQAEAELARQIAQNKNKPYFIKR